MRTTHGGAKDMGGIWMHRCGAWAGLAGLLFAGAAAAQFSGQQNILGQDPELPVDGITADLDGDGFRDVVITADGDGTLGWYRHIDGAGTFGALRAIILGPRYRHIAAADLDGDGDTDLAVVENIANRVEWFENANGDGSTWVRNFIGFSFDGLVDPIDLAVADMDLDGDVDIVAVHNNNGDRDGRVGLYLNNGFGDPSFSQQRIAIVGRFPADVKLADLSGNGRPDILVAAATSDQVSWVPNNAGGYGAPQLISASQDFPQAVDTADLDGDGDLDVIAGSGLDNIVAWYANNLNAATPGFSGLNFIANGPAGPMSVASGDFDRDGDPDIAVAGTNGNTITWHENRLQTVDADFNTNRSLSGVLTRPQSVFVDDLNGSGGPDVLSVAGNLSSSNRENKVTLHVNNGSGSFSNRLISEFSVRPEFARTLDTDLDGDIDVLTGSNNGQLHLSRQTDGDYVSQPLIDQYPGLFDADVGDIDGDGDMDAVITQQNTGTVSWLANNAAAGGSGFFPVTNPISDAGSFQRIVPRLVDLDGDGDLDLAQIAVGAGELAWRANTDGLGSFGALQPILSDAGTLFQMAIADLDASGLPDFVLIAENGSTIDWIANQLDQPSPGFATPAPVGGIANTASLAIADIDGDGDLDVAAGGNTTASAPNIAWFANQLGTSGDWGPAQTIHTAAFPRLEPRTIALFDTDNDGDQDLVAGFTRGNLITRFVNDGSGGFGAPITVDSFARDVNQVSGVDLDGDSDSDLLTVEQGENIIAMFENQSPLPQLDFGDAPAPYPTLLADNGPRHGIGPLFLGVNIDSEADGQPNATATGDDVDAGSNDEDGVSFAGLEAGGVGTLTVVVSQANVGFVTAWVDFNQDGAWNGPGEQVVSGEAVTQTTQDFPFGVPSDALSGDTVARVRLDSSGSALAVTGPASDGEVEDHLVTVTRTPTVSIDDVSADEGNAGTTVFTFTVTLSETSAQDVQVDVSTVDNSATAASGDYVATTGSTTILAGNLSAPVEVTVNGDRLIEPDENFVLRITGASGATLGRSDGVGTIVNDDARPTITLTANPVSFNEAGGSSTLTATLSGPTGETVTAELDVLAGGTAGAADFFAPDRLFTIPAGETSDSVTLTGVDDEIFEGDETLRLAFGAVSNADPQLAAIEVTLIDSDSRPQITLAASASEINEAGGSSTLTATLTPASSEDVQFNVLLGDSGGASTASSGDVSINPVQLTIPAGQRTATTTLTAVDDGAFEGDEVARVTIGSIVGDASQGVPSVVDITVIDDDAAPAPDASVQPQSLSFGPQTVGTTSEPQLLFISNNGNAPLSVISFRNVSGNDAGSFLPFGNCTSVPQGASCNVGVEFRPSRAGTLTASVLIETDDPDNPVIAVPISGVGVAPPPPEDDDGIDASEEADAPNNGDGNGDGVPDAEQDNVASFRGRGNTFATLAVPAGTRLRNVSTTEPRQNDRPALIYPVGFLSFEIEGLAPGACVSTEIILDPDTSRRFRSNRARYFKFGPRPGIPSAAYYPFDFDGTTGVTDVSRRNDQIVYAVTLCDGLRGDDDVTANGRILDPGAPAFAPTPEPSADAVVEDRSGAWPAWVLLAGLLLAVRRRRAG